MQNSNNLKLVLIGDRGVGKRKILSTGFGVPHRASPLYVPIEAHQINVKTAHGNYNALCYDSLVNQSMVAVSDVPLVQQFASHAVHGADAIVFCYSADNPASLRSLPQWAKDVSLNLTPNTLLYLVETKVDLPRRVNDSDLKDFSYSIKFQEHFKVNALNKNEASSLITKIVERVNSVRETNKSNLYERTPTYLSPEKKISTGQSEVRYSDSKEKVILMEGSYVKKMTVVDESKPATSRSGRIESKNLVDKEPELEDF